MINLKGAKQIASSEICLSDVYKKKVNGKKVVIKKCSEDWIPQAIKEIVFLKMMNHQNIITLIDFYEDGENIYLVLPYIKKKKEISNTEKFTMFRDLIKVISYLHHNNIIQGDIKVENVLLSDTSQTYVIDFGSSYKFYTNTEKKTSLIGTEMNLPPEIRNDNHLIYDEKIDIWTSGVFLFETIIDGCMFDEDIENLRTDVLLDSEDFSSEMKDVIMRMTIEHPNMRPSAKECLTLLNEIYDPPKIELQEPSYNLENSHYIGNKCIKHCFSLSTALLALSLSSTCEPKLAVSLASCLLEDKPIYPQNLTKAIEYMKSVDCKLYHNISVPSTYNDKLKLVKEIFGDKFIELARN